jgi:GH43 family beta-xylosidase
MSIHRFVRLVLWGSSFCAGLASAQAPPHYFANPICEHADPWFIQFHGHYLACFSEANHAISVQMSDRLTVVGPTHVVWTAPATGPASLEVWAPELHWLDGRWCIYFAASDGRNQNHRAWVLQSSGSDPFGPYTLHGPLYTGDDPGLSALNRWAIDMTVLESGDRLYAIWSGWRDEQDIQYLYIAPMKDPVTIAAPRVRICANDDYLWERVGETLQGRGLNEGPEVLQHDGRTFLAFSCSGSWQPTYKIGLLELKPGTDPLRPEDWIKYSKPAFESTAVTYGVGHNSFVKSPDQTEDWLIYHAKMDRQDGWRRAVFAQRFTWGADGLPELGRPVAAGQLLAAPSGEIVRCVPGARRFSFDSANDLADWSYYGHHQLLHLEGGKLCLGELRGQPINEFRSGEKVVFEGGLWTNFTLTGTIWLPDQHGQAGFLFRVSDPFVGYNGQRGYFAGIDCDKQQVVLGFTDGKAWHPVASGPLTKPPGADCELKVTARQNEIEIDCDGERVLQARDAAYGSGSIGLRVVDTRASFSDLQITPLSEPP